MALLAINNNDVKVFNFCIQAETIMYESIDTALNQDKIINYLTEFLNLFDLPGILWQILIMKIGILFIFFRNINPIDYDFDVNQAYSYKGDEQHYRRNNCKKLKRHCCQEFQ